MLSCGFARLAAWRGGEGVHHQGVILAGTLQLERQTGHKFETLADADLPQ